MSASLVGSEMCIRDRGTHGSRRHTKPWGSRTNAHLAARAHVAAGGVPSPDCLLYTSDAADDM
eukprot:4988099-Alexandrium_andersonii.AAC.1